MKRTAVTARRARRRWPRESRRRRPGPVEDDDAVAEPLGLLDVVGDEHDGGAGVADAAHDVPRVAAADRVEVLGQLVEEHELGAADEGEGDEQPLALAAGQGGERAAPAGASSCHSAASSSRGRGDGCSEANRRRASPTRIRSGRAASWSWRADPPAEPVAGGRRVEAEHRDRAAVGAAQALQDLDGGRLAGAVGAEEAEQLAAAHGEGDAAEHLGRCRSACGGRGPRRGDRAEPGRPRRGRGR